MNKEVLIVTSYFPPEIGAASNRIFHLAKGLQERNFDVSVVTPLPNYPTGQIFKEYRGKFSASSKEDNIHVHRLWIYASNSKNKFLRLFAMLSYSFSLIWFIIRHKIPKTVIVQSPPLLVAFTCMFFLRGNRELILNVSDLWPIAGLKLGAFKKNFTYRILERMERYNYRKATLVLGQSEEIVTHVIKIVPKKRTFLYRNYPQINKSESNESIYSSDKLRIVYAGLLGVAQGIYKLCENLDNSNIEFHIYGSGAEANIIESFVASNPTTNIFYHGELKREVLHSRLQKYDVAIVPLLKRIYGSVPSKIFEYSLLGLPILYFGGGEGEEIIVDYNIGWVAEPENYAELNSVINKISLSKPGQEMRDRVKIIAQKEFSFNNQLNSLIEIIKQG